MKAIERKLAEKYGNSILYSETELRPVHVNGSGKWSSNYRSSKAHDQINEMEQSGLFHYETGNDAPRGGATGEYHRFTPKVRRLGLKRKDEREALERLERKKIELAEFAKKKKESLKIQDEQFSRCLPIAEKYANQIRESKQLEGKQKSDRQASILKSILERAGIEEVENFWSLWRRISRNYKIETETA